MLKGDAENPIHNTLSKTTSAIFSACKRPTGRGSACEMDGQTRTTSWSVWLYAPLYLVWRSQDIPIYGARL